MHVHECHQPLGIRIPAKSCGAFRHVTGAALPPSSGAQTNLNHSNQHQALLGERIKGKDKDSKSIVLLYLRQAIPNIYFLSKPSAQAQLFWEGPLLEEIGGSCAQGFLAIKEQ